MLRVGATQAGILGLIHSGFVCVCHRPSLKPGGQAQNSTLEGSSGHTWPVVSVNLRQRAVETHGATLRVPGSSRRCVHL